MKPYCNITWSVVINIKATRHTSIWKLTLWRNICPFTVVESHRNLNFGLINFSRKEYKRNLFVSVLGDEECPSFDEWRLVYTTLKLPESN